MKHCLVIIFMFGWKFAVAQDIYEINNYNLVIKGSSNLNDWEIAVKQLWAEAEITGDANGIKGVKSLHVDVPVRGLKSSGGAGMDNRIYQTLNAEYNPFIQYRLERVTGMTASQSGYILSTLGTLTMAGVTRQVALEVVGNWNPAGMVTFSGNKQLLMTDFNIRPPTALFGILSTNNAVEVQFQIELKKSF